MKRIILKTATIMTCICLILLNIAPYQANATSYKINLKDNQLFYILPGNDSVDYQVKLTSGSQLNGTMSCMTSDAAKATISNDGALNILDAGTFQVSVTYNGETITRKVQSLLRSDWTRVISITNAQKITVSNNRVATYKIKNLMHFPLKVTLNYNTYDANMKPIQSERLHDFIYLAASETITYKEIVPENIKYITVNQATFTYDQYGLDTISTKKVSIKETISTSTKSKNAKVIKETVTNTNSKNILVPYQTLVYDKDGKIASISYNTLKVLPNQKNVFSGKYYTKKPAGQSEYASKMVYKFFTPIPEF